MTDIHRSQSGNIEWRATPDAGGAERDLQGLFKGTFEVEGLSTTGLITTDVGQDLFIDPDGNLILPGQATWPSVVGSSGDVLTIIDAFGTLGWQPGSGGGSTNFLGLTDTPGSYVGQAGLVPVVNGTEDALEFVSIGGTLEFTGLIDTPASYSGFAGQSVIVNLSENGLEFGSAPASDFVSLTDTPANYTGAAGQVVAVNGAETGLEFITAGSSSFTALTDTPADYTGQGGLFVRVNVGETGLEFAAGGAGGLNNVVEDTTPQLGGDLDVNGFDIVSVGGTDIDLVPDSGTVNIGTGGPARLASSPGETLELVSGTGTLQLGDANTGSTTIATDVGEDLIFDSGTGTVFFDSSTGAGEIATDVGNDLVLSPGSGTLVIGSAGDAVIASDPGDNLVLNSGSGIVTIGTGASAIIASDAGEDIVFLPGSDVVQIGNSPSSEISTASSDLVLNPSTGVVTVNSVLSTDSINVAGTSPDVFSIDGAANPLVPAYTNLNFNYSSTLDTAYSFNHYGNGGTLYQINFVDGFVYSNRSDIENASLGANVLTTKSYVDPTVQAGGTVTTNTDFDPDLGTEIHFTFGAAATAEIGFSASSIPSVEMTMEITNGGQGTLTWGTEVQWASGTPPTLTAAGTDLLKFWTRDNATTVIGWVVALNVS